MNNNMRYSVTQGFLESISLPEQSNTYKPVSHSELIDLTLSGISKAGFVLDTQEYASGVDGAIANGKYTIKNVADGEMQLQVGWQNSYDKSLSLKFAIGTSIFICTNGCVAGDFGSFKRKHTGDVQTIAPSTISEYIMQAGDAFITMQQQREMMKNIEITKRTAAELIGRLFLEESFITSTQLNIISREMQSPTFDYNASGSLWELYNHVTHSLKNSHPANWMSAHINAHKFFADNSGGITSPKRNFTANIEVVSPFTQLEIF